MSASPDVPELRVRRDDLAACQVVDGEGERDDLADGEARLLVERFALTTNTLTYATLGDRLGYWRLFPAAEGWGRIPAWGYARVLASRSPALPEGRRVFGLVPMGRNLTLRPAPHPLGVMDAAPHRAGLSPVYNQYLWVEGEGDDAALVLRPLFGSSVILDLALAEAGCRTAVLTSASSKTAYGLAHLLRERQAEVIGLTSAARREWVEGLGLYDAVVAYDELERLRPTGDAVLVDFAGDPGLLRAVQERLGGALRRTLLVGVTHARAEAETPPGELFFVPDEIVRRGRSFGRRYAEAWERFAPVAARTLRIDRIEGADALVRAYRELLAGRADPAAGYGASL
jgi:hypothetical protein